jgi:hypothetical protein
MAPMQELHRQRQAPQSRLQSGSNQQIFSPFDPSHRPAGTHALQDLASQADSPCRNAQTCRRPCRLFPPRRLAATGLRPAQEMITLTE